MLGHKRAVLIVLAVCVIAPILLFFLYPLGFGLRHRMLKAWIIQSLTAPELQRDFRADIHRQVISYLEQRERKSNDALDDVFVAFDYLGMTQRGHEAKAYGWCSIVGFQLVDDQIIDRTASSGPLAVLLEKANAGYKVVGDEEQLKTTANIEIFPYRLWHYLFNNFNETDSIFEILRKCRDPVQSGARYGMRDDSWREMQKRMVSDLVAKMPDDRFFRKQKPQNTTDPHKHENDIYSLLNLKATYKRISIKAGPEEVWGGGGTPVASPDGRFMAWVEVGRGNHLYFKDLETGTISEIQNQTEAWQSELTWKDDHVLVYDQINGFRLGEHGVHIELDVAAKEILWAAPYGALGFPKAMEN